MKQKLLQDVGSIITTNRSNVGRRNKKRGVNGDQGLTFDDYLDAKNMSAFKSTSENSDGKILV